MKLLFARWGHHPVVKWIRESRWSFPLLLLIPLLLATIFGVHGSSIGIYHSLAYGEDKDSSLLVGEPRAIRSDEWKVWTPTALSQETQDFSAYNELLGTGRDVSTKPDAPTLEWASIFKPYNWSFFIMPFENAFAFRWWFVIYALIVCAYFFVLKFFKSSKKTAILLSIAFGLSPFFLWWYQSLIFMAVAYAFLALILGMYLFDKRFDSSWPSRLKFMGIILGLAYLGIAFGFLIYLPFLLPIGIVIAAFLVGYLIDRHISKKLPFKQLLRRLGALVVATLLIGLGGLLYYIDNKEVIGIISDSQYPGSRRVESGGAPELTYSVLGSYLQPVLQSESRGRSFFTNQSEASSFILLAPFLLIPALFLQVKDFVRRRKIRFTLLAVNLVILLFLARIFIPFGDPLYSLTMLDRVPHARLLIGLGFASFLQIVLLLAYRSDFATYLRRPYIITYVALCFAVMVAVGLVAAHYYPKFISSPLIICVLAAGFSILIYLILQRKVLLFCLAFLGYTAASSALIMPLYQGLGFLDKENEVISSIRTLSDDKEAWVVLDDMNFQNLPMVAGRRSYGGTQIYTDKAFWSQLDPTGKYENVYNRQAHAIFISNTISDDDPRNKSHNITSIVEQFELLKVNVFKVRFDCSAFTYENIQYVLATTNVGAIPCLDEVKVVRYPKTSFYFYKVVTPAQQP